MSNLPPTLGSDVLVPGWWIAKRELVRPSPTFRPGRVSATVSYYGNLPPGGTIVLTGTAVFLAASLVETVASVTRR